MTTLNRVLLSVLLLWAFSAAAEPSASNAFKSGVFEPPYAAPPLELQGSNGEALSLRRFRGKVVAVAFGFSTCPRICPTTLANLSIVSSKLGDAAKNFQVVFVTVDPERDTPERLREFLGRFNPTFLGATGTPKQLEAVRQAYGVSAKKALSPIKDIGYEVHHSSSVFLIDANGMLRLLVPFGKPADDILHDVKRLLPK